MHEISILTQVICLHADSYQPPKGRQASMIILDHQRFSFNSTNVTIAWKLEDNNMSCKSPVNFTIQSSTCITGSIAKSWYTTDMEYSFSSTLFSTNHDNQTLYFIIVANSSDGTKCASLPFHFQFSSQGMKNFCTPNSSQPPFAFCMC